MVKVTVILCTKRLEPHFEWAFQSLINQTYDKKNIEYIIVDGHYHKYGRKEYVQKLIKDIIGNAFPVMYIPDKASRWKGKRPCLCNARNTGVIFANGEYICFHDDCCRLDNRWIERHVKWYEKGYGIVAGSWKYYKDMGSKEFYKDEIEYRARMLQQPTEIGGEWVYGANFGFNIRVALDINAFDEYLDGEMGQDDISFGIRTKRKGYKIIFDPDCIIEYFRTGHTSIMKDHGIIPVNIKLRDGLDHFSNEYVIQELLDSPSQVWTRGNTIDIKGSREIWKSGKYGLEEFYKMMESWVDSYPFDWRDNKLISDKLREMK